ncbi:hypothetical protein M9H77_09288 [Catharanthus roseus]|uniref:Uncharacterized protein n=1 Tax=Catharanthus roseus TaxID=4058 RepID=A0ACC0C048_CATRO|nr:hypothetical protein M9H77_09288 [Catharanthus roseus]
MGEKMFAFVVHHHGHFVNYLFLCYDGSLKMLTLISCPILKWFMALKELDSRKNINIHTTNEGKQRDSFMVAEEEYEMDLVDVHIDMPEKDYNEGNDQSDHFSERSDLEFFLHRDSLNDTYSLVAAEIDREYAEYLRSREKGKHQENVVSSDSETLDVPYGSEQEEDNWPEFNKERDMTAAELKARLVFSSVYVYRKALIEYLNSKGIEIAYMTNDMQKVTVCCKNKCSGRIHASRLL